MKNIIHKITSTAGDFVVVLALGLSYEALSIALWVLAEIDRIPVVARVMRRISEDTYDRFIHREGTW